MVSATSEIEIYNEDYSRNDAILGRVPDWLNKEIQKYLDDSKTQVWINHNN